MLTLFTLFATLQPSQAATLAGVTLPDQATVGGRPLVLNGLGLREKYFIDVYVGGLYLPEKTKDARKAIDDDVPKRIVMHFVYSEVGKDKLVEAFDYGFDSVGAKSAQASGLASLNGMMETVKAGDQVVLDYVPGTGTTVTVRGEKKGTIPGAEFMKALWGVYLGPSPPTGKLKSGMLSG